GGAQAQPLSYLRALRSLRSGSLNRVPDIVVSTIWGTRFTLAQNRNVESSRPARALLAIRSVAFRSASVASRSHVLPSPNQAVQRGGGVTRQELAKCVQGRKVRALLQVREVVQVVGEGPARRHK